MIPTISIEAARARLAWLWFVWSGVLLVLLLTRLPRAIDPAGKIIVEDVASMFSWYSSHILPNLGTILAVIAGNAMKGLSGLQVRRGYYRMTFAASSFYLSIATLTMFADLLIGLVTRASPGPLEVYDVSGIWLGLFEGAVITMIGSLFISARQESAAEDS